MCLTAGPGDFELYTHVRSYPTWSLCLPVYLPLHYLLSVAAPVFFLLCANREVNAKGILSVSILICN